MKKLGFSLFLIGFSFKFRLLIVYREEKDFNFYFQVYVEDEGFVRTVECGSICGVKRTSEFRGDRSSFLSFFLSFWTLQFFTTI